jgi:hypothetical protein
MKTFHFLYAALFCLLIFSCGQSDAQKKASEISGVVDQSSATETNGSWLKATIDGKKWQASKMTDYRAGSDYKLVSGQGDDFTISFQIHKPTEGMTREFRDDNVADFWSDDGVFGGRKGKVTITKIDAQWIEGSFYFTANSTSSNKTYEVKDGLFRIPNR